MSSLSDAYESLNRAKKEEHELVLKRNRLNDAYNTLRDYCFEHPGCLDMDIELERANNTKKNNWKQLLFCLAVYILVYGIIDAIAVLAFDNYRIITTSIGAGIGSYSVFAIRFISEIVKSNKRIKTLKGVQESLGDDPKYNGKLLKDILELIGEDKEIIQNDIYALSGSITEYENALNKANNELAEEVLERSGIEATVSLKTDTKVLAKRYEEKK